MVNFRYHIVSITAVFLALGLGLALGTSFGNSTLVSTLKANQKRLDTEVRETRARDRKLAEQIATAHDRDNAFTDQAITSSLLSKHLTQVPVLVVAPKGVDDRTLNRVRTSLETSGATLAGTLRLDSRLRLEGDDAAKAAKLLGTTSSDPTVVRDELARQVAAALLLKPAKPAAGTTTSTTTPSSTASANGSSTTVPTTATPGTLDPGVTTTTVPTTPTTAGTGPITPTSALIAQLRSAGFLSYEAPPAGSRNAALSVQAGTRIVIVSDAGAVVSDEQFLLPLVRAMAVHGDVPVLVATAALGTDPEGVREATVGPIRTDATLAARISTVDDLEVFDGMAATILGLDELGAGRHGHYGYGAHASAPLPAATAGP